MVLNGTDHLAKKVREEEEDPTPSLDIFKGKDRDFLVCTKPRAQKSSFLHFRSFFRLNRLSDR
jgi:hypothetical protein